MMEEEQEEPSLDQLSQVFAEAIGRSKAKGDSLADSDAEASSLVDDLDSGSDFVAERNSPSKVDPDEACPISPKTILEAILFVGHPNNEPIKGQSIAKLLRGVEEDELPELVRELNDDYLRHGMPYEVVTESATVVVDGDEGDSASSVPGYRLNLRDEFSHLQENFYGRVREAQLSQLAIDVLAVVAYNQPISREEIDRLLATGLDTGRVINQLLRRDLLARETKEDKGKARSKQFMTTDRFLTLFNLETIGDLPKTDDPE